MMRILLLVARTVLTGCSWLNGMFNFFFNPLSANSDQKQFSPNNIHTLSRDKVMRINKMISKGKMPWSFIKFSQLILKENVWRSVWRICMWYWVIPEKIHTPTKEGMLKNLTGGGVNSSGNSDVRGALNLKIHPRG